MKPIDFIHLLDSPAYCSCCGDSLPIPATNKTDTEYRLCEYCIAETINTGYEELLELC